MSGLSFGSGLGVNKWAVYACMQQQQAAAAQAAAAKEAEKERAAQATRLAAGRKSAIYALQAVKHAKYESLQQQIKDLQAKPGHDLSWQINQRWHTAGSDWQARERKRLTREIARLSMQLKLRSAGGDTANAAYVAYVSARLERAKADLAKLNSTLTPEPTGSTPVKAPVPGGTSTPAPTPAPTLVTTAPAAATPLAENWKLYYTQKVINLNRQIRDFENIAPNSAHMGKLKALLKKYQDALSSATPGISGLGFSVGVSPWAIGAALIAGYFTICPPGVARRKRLLGF